VPYLEKEAGAFSLFFSLEGIVVIMSLNKMLSNTWIKVVTILEMVATLQENNWARWRFV
jgi:hypothetical protein